MYTFTQDRHGADPITLNVREEAGIESLYFSAVWMFQNQINTRQFRGYDDGKLIFDFRGDHKKGPVCLNEHDLVRRKIIWGDPRKQGRRVVPPEMFRGLMMGVSAAQAVYAPQKPRWTHAHVACLTGVTDRTVANWLQYKTKIKPSAWKLLMDGAGLWDRSVD